MAQQFECPQDGCSFMVRSENEDEVVHYVREHATDKHGMSMSDGDIQKGMQAA